MKVTCCKECGHPVELQLEKIYFTPTEQEYLMHLRAAGQAGISSKDLMSKVYRRHPDGGPSSMNMANVYIAKLRSKLRSYGLEIVGRRGNRYFTQSAGGQGSVYVLRKIEKVDA